MGGEGLGVCALFHSPFHLPFIGTRSPKGVDAYLFHALFGNQTVSR